MKKIVIAAGTGFLGQVLSNYFKEFTSDIVVFTRGKSQFKNGIQYVNWDAKTIDIWQIHLENASLLINLTGKSVDCRYTEKNKSEILSSRVDSTNILNIAVLMCKNPPKYFINASTSTIYRHSLDKQMDEKTGEIGNDFSINVAKKWEETFFKTNTPKTLKTAARISIVLGKNGGAFPILKRLTKLGFGGKNGKGNQFISWIHQDDFAKAIHHIYLKELIGCVNLVSPQPINNQKFMKILQTQLKVPFAIPIPEISLKIGAKIIGTETELVLKSRNVIPTRLLESGFVHQYESLDEAIKNIY
jgi:uncharacterized protein